MNPKVLLQRSVSADLDKAVGTKTVVNRSQSTRSGNTGKLNITLEQYKSTILEKVRKPQLEKSCDIMMPKQLPVETLLTTRKLRVRRAKCDTNFQNAKQKFASKTKNLNRDKSISKALILEI